MKIVKKHFFDGCNGGLCKENCLEQSIERYHLYVTLCCKKRGYCTTLIEKKKGLDKND